VLSGGRSSAGMSASPITLVSALKPTRKESRSGIGIAALTPSLVQTPPTYSVWWVPVFWMHSMPANLAGWWSATSRAAVSPTKSWIGVAMQAIVSGISTPSRCRRSRRPRSIPTA
jgi:hypothetical protein